MSRGYGLGRWDGLKEQPRYLSFTKDWEEPDQRLAMVLSHLRHAGLKLNPKKCQVARTEVAFLGHVVSGERVRPDPRLLQAERQRGCSFRPSLLPSPDAGGQGTNDLLH